MRRMNQHLIMVLVPLLLHVAAPWCWAGVQEGYNAYSRGDYATALHEWLPLAQQGDAPAQYNLGLMYLKGQGVSQDFGQAMQWFRRAADQGDAPAQYNLGLMYTNGRGVPQNSAEALRWYRRAADQGHADAQATLGLMYYLGQGAPQDFVQAYFWLTLAAALFPPGTAYDGAVRARDYVVQEMTPSQLAQGQALARTWQLKPETPGALPSPSTPPSQPQEGAAP